MTTVIFVRHGQSRANVEKIFTGQANTPLTELGMRQAARTAEFLKDYPISVIYASDLDRAMETARPTAELHSLPIHPDPALREVFAGEWEGLPYQTLLERYPDSFRRWGEDIGNAHPNGGESVKELQKRVVSEVERLVELHRGECIAMFSHATPARALGCHWLRRPTEEMARIPWVPNASVSVVEYDDNGDFRLVLYAYDQHQGEESTVLPKGQV